MAANSLADSSAGAVVFMLIVGLLLALWPIAIITNFRGYRDFTRVARPRRAADSIRG